jgi:uncharacterized protein (DUF1800 family)
MKKPLKIFLFLFSLSAGSLLLFSFFQQSDYKLAVKFPYKKAGLTERQAAAHLLSRFTYGATPGQIDAVVDEGLEKWFKEQLEGTLADDSLNRALASYDLINYTNTQIANTFPRGGQLVRMAVAEGVINKDSVGNQNRKEYRDKLDSFMTAKGLKPERELFRQFINQKILRATLTQNQLREVMTDFWFNHFNVSITKNDCATYIPTYERDVIRPNALGKFEDLVLQTAKSPAMLLYLDNFTSTGVNTDMDNNTGRYKPFYVFGKNPVRDSIRKAQMAKLRSRSGLNENYAREVMELHTLGVDGGYTQSDVTQAAGVLTGWTIYPMNDYYGRGKDIKKLMDKIGEDSLSDRGFVHDKDFLFAPTRHDNTDKVVLGKTFKGSDGYKAGEELLEMLAHHPSTARFISKKLAVRFVSDNPPKTLIDKMARTFLDKKGDIKQVLITMVSSPEFWSADALREKTKSPFELVISSVRALNAQVLQPYQLFTWMDRMGQKIYYYQAPTGFPDRAQYWINTGALLNRMNFGLALVQQRIPGVKVNLLALNNNHEPESTKAALTTYSKLLMPERNLDETIRRLTPLLNDPELDKKVDKAAVTANNNMARANDQAGMMQPAGNSLKEEEKKQPAPMAANLPPKDDKYQLTQVVGIIIGSPEFQRR